MDDYIVCGSETNEVYFLNWVPILLSPTVSLVFIQSFMVYLILSSQVYSYHRSLSMPITSYKFGSVDALSGLETSDDNGQFVSSVCWAAKTNMIVAANSCGAISVLQMV